MENEKKALEQGVEELDLQSFFKQKGYEITNEDAIFCYYGQSYEELANRTYPKDNFGILAKDPEGKEKHLKSVFLFSLMFAVVSAIFLFLIVTLIFSGFHPSWIALFSLFFYLIFVRVGKNMDSGLYSDLFVAVITVDEKTNSCALKINGKNNLHLAAEWAKEIKEKFSLDVSIKLRSRWTKYHTSITDSNTPYG